MEHSHEKTSVRHPLFYHCIFGLLSGSLFILMLFLTNGYFTIDGSDQSTLVQRLFYKAILYLLTWTVTLSIIALLRRNLAEKNRPSFWHLMAYFIIPILVASLIAGLFQMYTLPGEATAAGFSPLNLFTSTFLYFFFLGIFVAIIIAAFAHKAEY